MITSMPKWVEYGTFVLALTAGCINAIGLLGFAHQAVSHLSGTATQLGANLIAGNLTELLHLFAILLSFMLGAAVSGFVLSGISLKLGRHYDSLLWAEAGLLAGAALLLVLGNTVGHYLASAACGLQNALVTTYSGAIIRTTHITGIFTDLGIMLGAAGRGKTLNKRRFTLFIIIIVGFTLGGSLGAALFAKLNFYALFVPAATCGALAIVYRLFTRQMLAKP